MTAHSVRPDGERVNLEADSPAFTELCRASWAVQIGRLVITKSIPFGAVIVYAAACAWASYLGPGFMLREAAAIRESAQRKNAA